MNEVNKIESEVQEIEVDLNEILNSLLRKKFFISLIAAIFLILTGIKILTSQKGWKGGFAINLSELSKLNPKLENARKNINEKTNVLPFIEQKNKLKKEVSLINSQNTLLPAFNLTKNESKNSALQIKIFDFDEWKKNNLNIKLDEDTSILNVTYEDKNKKFVLPVLQKILKEYLLSSERERMKDIEEEISYLERALKKFKEKSLISSRQIMERKISDARTEIKRINSLLNQMDKYPEEIFMDYSINRFYKSLILKKTLVKAEIDSLENLSSNQVVSKYKSLDDSNKNIISNLENQKDLLELEETRLKNQVSVKQEPTIIYNENDSNKKLLLLSLIIGLLIGSIIALILERIKGLIYSENELKHIIGIEPILRLNSKYDSYSNLSLSLFLKTIDDVGFLIVGDISENYLNQLDNNLNKLEDSKKILISKNIRDLENYEKKYLLIQKGSITRKGLTQLMDLIRLVYTDLDGWILFSY